MTPTALGLSRSRLETTKLLRAEERVTVAGGSMAGVWLPRCCDDTEGRRVIDPPDGRLVASDAWRLPVPLSS